MNKQFKYIFIFFNLGLNFDYLINSKTENTNAYKILKIHEVRIT